MSQENVEIVRRLIDAQNRDDLAESLRLYSPEAEIDWSRSKGPLRGVYRGHVGDQELPERGLVGFRGHSARCPRLHGVGVRGRRPEHRPPQGT